MGLTFHMWTPMNHDSLKLLYQPVRGGGREGIGEIGFISSDRHSEPQVS